MSVGRADARDSSFRPVLKVPVVEDSRIRGIVHHAMDKQISDVFSQRTMKSVDEELDKVFGDLMRSFKVERAVGATAEGGGRVRSMSDVALPERVPTLPETDPMRMHRRMVLLRGASAMREVLEKRMDAVNEEEEVRAKREAEEAVVEAPQAPPVDPTSVDALAGLLTCGPPASATHLSSS